MMLSRKQLSKAGLEPREKAPEEVVKEMDISKSGYLYYIDTPTRVTGLKTPINPTIPLEHILSEDAAHEEPIPTPKTARPARRVRKHLEKFILRDYGILEVPSLRSSIRVLNARIISTQQTRTFAITEATNGRLGSAFSITIEARDEHDFKTWNTAFKEIQRGQSTETYSASPDARIAKGTNGDVFAGIADSDGSPIVVKIISRIARPIPALVESYVGKRLMVIMPERYPTSLIRCLAVYHTPRETQIVMERIFGPGLSDWLEEHGPMEDADAHRVFVRVLSAVKYLHKLGILHGAVTTRNVLICESDPDAVRVDSVKLIDFSVASMQSAVNSVAYYPSRTLDEYKRSLRHDGLEYIAPELWQGMSASLLTDFWSLGCLLYRMLVGPLPFATEGAHPWNATKIGEQVIGGKLQEYAGFKRIDKQQSFLLPNDCPRVSRLSPDARSILFQLLRPNRNHRLGPRSIDRHPWVALSRSPPSSPAPTFLA